MSDQNLDNAGAGTAQRPTFLTVLCILSFIGAGISIIMLLLAAAAMGVIEAGVAGAEAQGAVVESQTGGIWLWVGISVVLSIVSLVGVIKMWKLQKSGFMIYAGASVAGMIVSVIMSGFGPAIFGILVSAAFIVMYQLNTKHMK